MTRWIHNMDHEVMAQSEGAEEEAGPSVRLAVSIEAPVDLRYGVYANIIQVRHTRDDFVIDCGHVLPPQSRDELDAAAAAGRMIVPSRARIIVPASLMPRIIAALQANLATYQKRFGPIPSAAPEEEQDDGAGNGSS